MTLQRDLAKLQREAASLNSFDDLKDKSAYLRTLVHARGPREYPVHRWYFYKEAFSPRLPQLVVRWLGHGRSRSVADVFGGVGTTAVALEHLENSRVTSIEYSPFAHLVGSVKVGRHRVRPARLRTLVRNLLADELREDCDLPALSAFTNHEIFPASTASQLVDLRQRIAAIDSSEDEKAFMLVGLAGSIDQVANVLKDGRALRILRKGRRRRRALVPRKGPVAYGDLVRSTVGAHWAAMIDDLDISPGRPDMANVERLKSRQLKWLPKLQPSILIRKRQSRGSIAPAT